MRTWRLPRFSALYIVLSASCRTEIRTILTQRRKDHKTNAVEKNDRVSDVPFQRGWFVRKMSESHSPSREGAPCPPPKFVQHMHGVVPLDPAAAMHPFRSLLQ